MAMLSTYYIDTVERSSHIIMKQFFSIYIVVLLQKVYFLLDSHKIMLCLFRGNSLFFLIFGHAATTLSKMPEYSKIKNLSIYGILVKHYRVNGSTQF
jgi:hypothetical protein